MPHDPTQRRSRVLRPSRRELLELGAAGLVGGVLPRRVRAAPSVGATDRRFVFVFANGGWDPTRALFPAFDLPVVDMEAEAELLTFGELGVVGHPDRPAVARFFSDWGDRAVLLHGLQVPAIDHFTCARLVTTDSPGATEPDWAAVLGGAVAEHYPAPHLVLGGPSFPGEHAASTVSAGFTGQLSRLVDPTSGSLGNAGGWQPAEDAQARMDTWLEGRFAAATGAGGRLPAQLEAARGRQLLLMEGLAGVDLAGATNLEGNLGVAVDVLREGLSRVVSLGYPSAYEAGNWDTHADNDVDQGTLFEILFSGLCGLMEDLSSTPGLVGETLADETVVVVFSEMGRSPYLDLGGGKGHWVYTSALLLGPGLRGGRAVGGYDERFQGSLVDPVDGSVQEDGVRIAPGTFGATLLALGGVDPGERLPGEVVLEAILS